VTKSPRLYVLFRTAVPGVKLVTRLPFVGLCVAEWCGACHLTKLAEDRVSSSGKLSRLKRGCSIGSIELGLGNRI
jgi:hypothetical protein